MNNLIRSTLSASIVVLSLTSTQAQANDPELENANAWSAQCNASAFVQKRINHLETSEVIRASGILANAGLVSQLSKLEFEEACLSLAATHLAKAPVITLNFQRASPFGLGASEEVREDIMERLDLLDVGYSVPGEDFDDGSLYQELYHSRPRELKKSYWNTLTQSLATDSRSVAGQFRGHCIVLHDTYPFERYLHGVLRPPLNIHLDDYDREWISKYGTAIEFLHEVSHCKQSSLNQYASPHGSGVPLDEPAEPLLMADPVGAVDAIYAQAGEESAGIDLLNQAPQGLQSPANGQCPITQSAFDNPLQSNPVSDASTDETNRNLSSGFMALLKSEVEADLFAQNQVVQRFGAPSPGCRDFRNSRQLDTWNKVRMGLSMFAPGFEHMTWVNPWLHDLDIIDQMQVALEAWEANQSVAVWRQLSCPVRDNYDGRLGGLTFCSLKLA